MSAKVLQYETPYAREVAVAPRAVPSVEVQSPSFAGVDGPCSTCSSLIFWRDAYGSHHCATCDPIPTNRASLCRAIVAAVPNWWIERVKKSGVVLPGFPASLCAPARGEASRSNERGDRDVTKVDAGSRPASGEAEGGGESKVTATATDTPTWSYLTLDVPKDVASSLVLFIGEEGDELFEEAGCPIGEHGPRWWGLWMRRWRRVKLARGEFGTRDAIAVGKILNGDGTVSEVEVSRVEIIFERYR